MNPSLPHFAEVTAHQKVQPTEQRAVEILLAGRNPVRTPAVPRSEGVNEQIATLLPDAELLASGVAAPAAGVDCDWAVEQFCKALYQFAFSLSGSASNAADLTQETYRVLLLKADQIRDPQKVKSWLFTTLYREFLRGRQHLSRFPEVELEEAVDDLPAISAANVDELDAAAILSAVQGLEEKNRASVAMFYLDNLSYKEIAEVLGIPIGTVMSRLSRGKLVLRQKLSEIFADEASGPRSTTTTAASPSKPA